MTVVGSIAAIFNSLSRIFWAAVADWNHKVRGAVQRLSGTIFVML